MISKQSDIFIPLLNMTDGGRTLGTTDPSGEVLRQHFKLIWYNILSRLVLVILVIYDIYASHIEVK